MKVACSAFMQGLPRETTPEQGVELKGERRVKGEWKESERTRGA